MNSKKFVLITLVVFSCCTLLLSLAVKYSINNHQLYKKSQARIDKSKIDSEVVFVGDSSLEYGLDEEYFQKLSGKKTLNLSLTADGHNLAASYNMIRHTIKNNKKVKYIVIMQTPFVWHKDFVVSGYCSTLGDLDSQEILDLGLIERMTCFKFNYFNLKQIYQSWKQNSVNESNKNNPILTYKNGGRDIFKEMEEDRFHELNLIGKTKLKEIKLIDNYVKDKNIKVFYIQGSLHYQLSKKYSQAIKKQEKILKEMKNITFIDKYLYPVNSNMGNTENHVDKSYQKISTKFYYEALKDYLN